MPRYFFHVAEGRKRARRAADAEFPNDELARAYALGFAEMLMQGGVAQAETLRLVVIRNDNGDVVDVVQAEKRADKEG